jgi:hypothetical protein
MARLVPVQMARPAEPAGRLQGLAVAVALRLGLGLGLGRAVVGALLVWGRGAARLAERPPRAGRHRE